MLLYERQLCLYRKLYVFQARGLTTVAGDSSQDPGAAFLIHQAARPINRICKDAPDSIRFVCAARQNNFPPLQPFGDKNDGDAACDLLFKQRDEQRFAYAVDRLNRVAFAIFDHL